MTDKPMIQLEAKDGHDAPLVPVGQPFPAPMSNQHLDRAIEAAEDATEGMPYFGNVSNHDRTYARALVAELLDGMQKDPYEKDNSFAKTYSLIGFNAALAEIRRRAGLEGEG